jgi:hypothetical protein
LNIHVWCERLAVLAVVVLMALGISLQGVVGAVFPEQQNYVHDYLNSPLLGNWTYMEKPMFPLAFNDSQIQIGQNWSVVSPLRANHSYHVYCYGEWIDPSAEPQTDYDIYVYDPQGTLEGYHTESAGLPEHLGTTVDDALFMPKQSGNYTFVVRNDPRESKAAQNATFMIVENIQSNIWHEHYVEGKDDSNLPVLNTSWAFEFMTESKHVELWVKVPETLDMYEVRLYLMANPKAGKGVLLNDMPLAWEPGLYGERNGEYGGYNLESKEDRGAAYASCENYGQDVFFNYTTARTGKSLYHLVFIGEKGQGDVEFLVKTEFGKASLKSITVPFRVNPDNETEIAYISNSTELVNATLKYSTNNWINTTSVPMEILNRTCRATILGQSAGTSVNYQVEAQDFLENFLAASWNYSVKYSSFINITVAHEVIVLGANITITGTVSPATENLPIIVYFVSTNKTIEVECLSESDGTFTASVMPETVGFWEVQAKFSGTNTIFDGQSDSLLVKVDEPSFFAKNALYIGSGVGVAAAIGIVVYLKKFRE